MTGSVHGYLAPLPLPPEGRSSCLTPFMKSGAVLPLSKLLDFIELWFEDILAALWTEGNCKGESQSLNRYILRYLVHLGITFYLLNNIVNLFRSFELHALI